MDFRYQAAIARALGQVRRAGAWSTRARSRSTGASTAARRWPKRRSSTRTTRRRRSTSSSRSRRRAPTSWRRAIPALAGRDVSVLIWTTTPWTIPSNLAIAFHPEFDYAAYDVDGRAVIVAEALAPTVAEVAGRTFGAPVARMKGAELEHIRFQHPLYARDSRRRARRLRHARSRHGAVHTAPGPRHRRLQHRRAVRARHLRAGRPGRPLPRHGRALRRAARVRRQPATSRRR